MTARLLAWLTEDAGPRYQMVLWCFGINLAVSLLLWLWGRL